MAFDGTLKFDTGIDSSGFQSGISSLGDIAKKGLSAIAGMVTAAAGAVTGLGMAAVNVGSGFEKAMAQVAATMGITKDTVQGGVNSYELLQQAAEEAGESTTFSASEAADALNYLALAGYSAEQAAEALPAVLNLAAAGGMELGYASNLATDAMAALGIEASKDNLTHFGDQLAKTASKANASVSQLGEAILVVGGTAKALSGGTEELNAALGVLANRGIKGAEGGTALRNIILALTAPTDKAAEKLTELGVSVLDSAGNMRGLDAIFQDLDKSLAGMSDGEKTQVLNEIFNKVDLKSAQAMLAGCGDEFRDLTAALSGCDGAMQQMADTMNDTLEGDMKSLQSKAEALGISVYDAISDPLRELAQTGGIYLSKLKSAFDAGGFEWAAKTLGGLLSDAVAKVGRYLPEVFAIGGEVVTALVGGIAQHLPQALRTGEELIKVLAGSVQDSAPVLMQTVLDVLRWLLDGFLTADKIAGVVEFGGELIGMLAASLLNATPELIGAAGALIGVLSKSIPADKLFSAVTGIVKLLGNTLLGSIQPLLDAGLAVVDALIGVLAEPDALTALLDAAIGIVTALVDLISENAGSLADAALLLITTLGAALLTNIPVLLGAAVEIVRGLVESLSEPDTLTLLLDAALDIIMTLAGCLTENLSPLLGAAISLVSVLGVWIAEHAPDLVDAALGIVQVLADALLGNTTTLIAVAGDIVTALCKELGEHSQDWLLAIEEIADTILQLCMNPEVVGTLYEAAARILAALIPAATEITGGLLGFVVHFSSTLGDFISNIDWAALGTAMLKGILSGLTGTDFDMHSFLGDFGENWVSGIQDVFDIHSPSKVMRDEVGKYLALGIGEGFTDYLPDVSDEAKQALSGLADGLELPELEVPELEVPKLEFEIPEMPEISGVELEPLTVEVLPQLEPIAELDGMEISVDTGAIRELLGLLPQLREVSADAVRAPEVSPEVLAAVREAQVSLSPSSFAPVGQSVVNNYNSYTTNSSTVNNQSSDAPEGVPVRDVIIPVSIGGEEVQTLVINAVRDANAVSGGVTV